MGHWQFEHNSNIVEYHSRLIYKRRANGPSANKIVKVTVWTNFGETDPRRGLEQKKSPRELIGLKNLEKVHICEILLNLSNGKMEVTECCVPVIYSINMICLFSSPEPKAHVSFSTLYNRISFAFVVVCNIKELRTIFCTSSSLACSLKDSINENILLYFFAQLIHVSFLKNYADTIR